MSIRVVGSWNVLDMVTASLGLTQLGSSKRELAK